ncbi:MAG: hypothetical protein E7167_00190 [Firmicutes bacterium]|nr:hypothetical protein [Bacillota bacterium]
MLEKLNLIADVFEIGKVKSFKKEESSQNNVYKVETNQGKYIIKEYSKDAIKNYYQLNHRKRQILVSEIFNRYGIKCILPIKEKDKYFVYVFQRYYLVYPYVAKETIEVKNFSKEHIVALAKTQCKMHSLRVVANIPFVYKRINIDFDKVLKKVKKDPEFKSFLEKNLTSLGDLIKNCNENISQVKSNFCISHNDYKPLNILWDGIEPLLLDFDAVGLVNPTCAMCESAFTFSKVRNRIKYVNFKLYLESYLEEYGPIQEDFKSALYVSMNGKLQWLSYILGKKRYEESQNMISELVLFYNNIEKFYKMYKDIRTR